MSSVPSVIRMRFMTLGYLIGVGFVLSVHAEAAQPQTYPVTLTQGSRLLVSARINGHPVEALLDSAAEATLIDPGFARTLGLKSGTTVTAEGSGDAAFSAELVKGVKIEAFGLTLKDQTVALTPLSDVGQRLLHRELQVVLGREIFDAARLRIDIEGHTVTVLDRRSTPAGVQLQLTEEHGVETVPAQIEGSGSLRATFDLGNGSGVLVSAVCASQLHLLTDGRPVEQSRGGGLGGETARQLFKLHTLRLAGREFHELPASIDARPSASDLNVGIDVLRHYVITTDFAARSVWLQPR